MYLIKTPWWLRMLYSNKLVWRMKNTGTPTVYLTFDDGPHETATPFVLDQLRYYDAKATFFCIGKNVAAHRGLFDRIREEAHAVGNHTQQHLNGWKTDTETYLADIAAAHKYIGSHLFRPPYGRIKKAQAYMLSQSTHAWKICMWDVLSADFDVTVTPEKCLENVLRNIEPGSIVVFHDSTKAWDRMSYALPRVLAYCKEKGWACKSIE